MYFRSVGRGLSVRKTVLSPDCNGHSSDRKFGSKMRLSGVEKSGERAEGLESILAARPGWAVAWLEPELPFKRRELVTTESPCGRLGCILTGARWESLQAVCRQME